MNIPGYNMFHKNLSIKGYSGFALYIENKYDCMEIEVDKFDKFILLCITGINTKLYICVIYGSPQSSSDNDIALINLMNNICKRYNDNIIFIGDFNLAKIKWNNLLYDEDNKINYNNLFIANLNNFLSQHVLEPTRIRSDQTQNILNLIILKGDFINNKNYSEPVGFSGRVVLTFDCDWKENVWEEERTIFCYERGNYNRMRKYFQEELKEFQNNDDSIVKERWEKLKEIINKGKKKLYTYN